MKTWHWIALATATGAVLLYASRRTPPFASVAPLPSDHHAGWELRYGTKPDGTPYAFSVPPGTPLAPGTSVAPLPLPQQATNGIR